MPFDPVSLYANDEFSSENTSQIIFDGRNSSSDDWVPDVAVFIVGVDGAPDKWLFDNGFFKDNPGNPAHAHEWRCRVPSNPGVFSGMQSATVGSTSWDPVSAGEPDDDHHDGKHKSGAAGGADADGNDWAVQFSWNLSDGRVTVVRTYTKGAGNYRVRLVGNQAMGEMSPTTSGWRRDKFTVPASSLPPA